jgi:hypothetical protein
MINYIWTVTAMYTLPKVEGYTDVVVIADWTLTGKEGKYSSSISNSTQFNLPQGENFTPYEDLTEVQVVGWIKQAIDSKAIEQYEAKIANDIYHQEHPPVTAMKQPLPF